MSSPLPYFLGREKAADTSPEQSIPVVPGLCEQASAFSRGVGPVLPGRRRGQAHRIWFSDITYLPPAGDGLFATLRQNVGTTWGAVVVTLPFMDAPGGPITTLAW